MEWNFWKREIAGRG